MDSMFYFVNEKRERKRRKPKCASIRHEFKTILHSSSIRGLIYYVNFATVGLNSLAPDDDRKTKAKKLDRTENLFFALLIKLRYLHGISLGRTFNANKRSGRGYYNVRHTSVLNGHFYITFPSCITFVALCFIRTNCNLFQNRNRL